MMAHGDNDLAIGDKVTARFVPFAGRLVPYFEKVTRCIPGHAKRRLRAQLRSRSDASAIPDVGGDGLLRRFAPRNDGFTARKTQDWR